MMVHPIGFLRAATGGNPAIVGTAQTDEAYSSSITVPYHADTVSGDLVFVHLIAWVASGTFSTPAGWTAQDVQASGTSLKSHIMWGVSGGETEKTFTLSGSFSRSGYSVAVRGGVVGDNDKGGSAGASATTAVTSSIDANGVELVFFAIAAKGTTITVSPTAQMLHEPTGGSTARQARLNYAAGVSGPTTTAVSYTHNYAAVASHSIAVNPS